MIKLSTHPGYDTAWIQCDICRESLYPSLPDIETGVCEDVLAFRLQHDHSEEEAAHFQRKLEDERAKNLAARTPLMDETDKMLGKFIYSAVIAQLKRRIEARDHLQARAEEPS